MINFNSNEIEKKWQNYWKENDINKTNNDFSNNKKKFYILDMFPYPSGEGLHVGHPKGYIATDIYSRMKKMQGYNVLHPMGFDAFGLPAEQFAIKNKINPNIATEKNVKRYKEQIEMLGINYDWDREINTTDPKYYKWTQWMFKQMYKDGLAYESFDPINWCPSCKTGLANEDLDGNACERCGTIVEKKKLRQWTIRITDYADRLLNDLDKLNWEPHIKELQRNWIGKSEGSEIEFEIVDKKLNFVILHAFENSPETSFYSWLKTELEKRGHLVSIPNLPESNDPKVYDQVDFVLQNIKFDNNTVIIGHSLGGVVALKVLEKLSNPIKKTILVGSYLENNFIDENFPEYTFDWNFDFNKIKSNSKEFILLRDIEDNLVPQENTLKLSKSLNGKLIDVVASDPHFFGKEEIEVLNQSFDKLKIFTTRADTLYGCTFMAISYTLAKEWIENGWNASDEIKNFIAKLEKEEKERTIDFDMSKLEKEGIDTGIKAINPANGEEVPIYIANYILSDYGTGAIMAVPAHDERDYEFAKKYNLEIREIEVIDTEEERKKITEKVGGKIVSKYKLKDWVFARQRYWGEPFPIVFDENRKSYAVADKELPVVLPNVENYEPTDTGESPLANIKDWVEVCGFINENGEFESSDSINDENPTEFFGDGEDVLRPDLEIINRKGIDVIIKDKDENFYFVKDKNLGINFVGGGIDNDSEIEAVKRELIEETGFIDFEIVGKLKRKIIWNGYHINKKRNQKSESSTYIIELKSDSRVKSEIETGREDGIHELVKLNKEDCINNINYKNHKLLFQDYLNGDFIEIKKFYRETNTMPQWAGSSWYYLRYIDTKNENEFVNKELEKIWSPVDFYVGGAEHATRHLIYARFWHKYLFDKGYVNYDEPFSKLQTVGLIMAEDGKKMSKRYGNVVNPDDIIREYGADTLRTYEMFMGPFEKAINWNTDSIIGVYRFLGRVYNLIEKIELEKEIEDNKEIERVINETIKKVGEDIEEFKFNTAIAQMMICLNSFEEETKKGNKISKKTFSDFIQILSPFAIHICEEIWQNVLGNNFSVHLSNWPKVDVTKITKEEIEMSLQINGKFRGNFIIKMNINDEELKENIKELEIYKKYITDINQIKKIIIVKNKLINIVI